jgi:putative PIN family toxin of toxin-antitoxin system
VIRPGVPRQAFQLACEQDHPALSQSVWSELVDVLRRRELARFVDPVACDALLELLRTVAVWIEPSEHVTDCRDTKDNKYLELALEAQAGCIVSSDHDLLVLNPWRGIRILRPAEYIDPAQRSGPET